MSVEAETAQTSRVRIWGALGLTAQVVFTAGWLIPDRWQGSGYRAIRYSISDETALTAPHAWFLIACQIVAGAGTIAFALFGLRPALATAGNVRPFAPWMLAVGTLSYLVIWPASRAASPMSRATPTSTSTVPAA